MENFKCDKSFKLYNRYIYLLHGFIVSNSHELFIIPIKKQNKLKKLKKLKNKIFFFEQNKIYIKKSSKKLKKKFEFDFEKAQKKRGKLYNRYIYTCHWSSLVSIDKMRK